MEKNRAIDAHVHVIEQIKGIGYRGELRPIGNGAGRWANGEELQIIPKGWGSSSFSYEELLKLMDENGIEKAVLLQGSLYGLQNEYSVEAVKHYPERFAALGSFDPYCLEAEKIMCRLIEQCGCRGLKFEMSSMGGFMGFHDDFQIGGKRMQRVWEYTQKNKLVVSLDIGDKNSPSFQLDEIVEIARSHPDVKIVIEHMFCAAGAEERHVAECLRKIAAAPNIYVTMASVITNCREQKPYPSALGYLHTACKEIGSERVMWGSDAPITATMFPYSVLKNYIVQYSGLEKRELENIYYNTAATVYGFCS